MRLCLGVLDMELFGSSCGWNFFYFIDPAELWPPLPVIYIILYMLNDYSVETRHVTKTMSLHFSPRPLHLSITSDSSAVKHGREPLCTCVSIECSAEDQLVFFLWQEQRVWKHSHILQGSLCFNLCCRHDISVSVLRQENLIPLPLS